LKLNIISYTNAVKFWRSSDTKIIDCSDNILNRKSTIISGFNNFKKIGPKYSIGKKVISYFVG